MESSSIFFEEARLKINDLIKEEFDDFPITLKNRLFELFNRLTNYSEEGVKIRPKIIVTNRIDIVVKNIPSSYRLNIFTDSDFTSFNSRLKSLLAFCEKGWLIYINLKSENIIEYGITKCINSLKEKSFSQLMFSAPSIKDIKEKSGISLIYIEPISDTTIQYKRVIGESIYINYGLTSKNIQIFEEIIQDFVNASFSKLRTTQKKLREIKTLYNNIFEKAFLDIKGAICVVVDKEYKDNGFLADGIWLEKPIEFSKLFLNCKSYNESTLANISGLFISMLNYDGITIVDNAGRIMAYNVFIETNNESNKKIVGGARKRAAYTIINSRRKKIIGVYFQSHDGDIFYKPVYK